MHYITTPHGNNTFYFLFPFWVKFECKNSKASKRIRKIHSQYPSGKKIPIVKVITVDRSVLRPYYALKIFCMVELLF